jgi:hypothetical protein
MEGLITPSGCGHPLIVDNVCPKISKVVTTGFVLVIVAPGKISQ